MKDNQHINHRIVPENVDAQKEDPDRARKNSSALSERITELEQLQDELVEALRRAEQGQDKYRQIVELLPEVIFEVDSQYNVKFLNENAYKVTGYSREDLKKGLKIQDLFAVSDRRRLLASAQRLLAGESVGSNIYTALTKSGHRAEVVVYSTPVKESGKVTGIRGVAVDITEKLEFQRQLETERNLIRSLLDTANGLVVCLDNQARILIFNDECERITGYKKDEVLGKSWPEIFVPEKNRWPAQYTFEEWVKKTPRDKYEGPIITKSGETRNIFWSNSAIWGKESGEFMAIAIGFDITDKKKTEAALIESEEKYQRLLEQSDDAIYLIVDGKFEFVNDRFVKLFGWSREELLSPEFEILNLVSPRSKKFMCSRIKASLAGERIPDRYEYTAITKDGREIELSVSLSRIRHGGKEIIQGVYRDITEEKGKQAALEESEKRYRVIWEKSPVGISVSDIDGVYHYVNPAYCAIYGYSEDELIGKNFMDLIVVPESRTGPPSTYRKAFEDGQPVPLGETEFLTKSGERRWVQYTGDFIYKDGEPIFQVTMNVDVTARKKTEEELKNSELRFKAQFKASPIPTYTWRQQGDNFLLTEFNDAAFKITNGKILDFVGIKLTELYSDRPELVEAISRCFAEKTSVQEEMQYLYKSTGEERFLDVILTYAPPDLVLVSTEDITRQRRNRVRSTARLNLLSGLRIADNIDDCLTLGCKAIFEAELFKRSVLTLHDEKREIINIGYHGLDDSVVKKARRNPAPDIETTRQMLQERFRISNSYFIPEESGLELHKQARHIGSTESAFSADNLWHRNDEFFSPIMSDSGRVIGWLSVDTPFDGKRPTVETATLQEELIEIVIKKTQAIHRLIELNRERQELQEKNIALNEVLAHIQEDKVRYKKQIGETVEQILLPALQRIRRSDGSVNEAYYSLLKNSLNELTSTMGKQISIYSHLSSREVEICEMIRQGLTSKDMAEILHITPGTIQKHREKIRKKFGIVNKDINLATYLKTHIE